MTFQAIAFCIVFGVIIFFILRKILNYLAPSWTQKVRDILSGILAVVFAPIFYLAMIYVVIFLTFYQPKLSQQIFDPTTWYADVQHRYLMEQDITKRDLFLHQTKTQIAQQVGLPRRVSDVTKDTLSKWTYDMGSHKYGMGLKFYYLDIMFDQGKSSDVVIREAID